MPVLKAFPPQGVNQLRSACAHALQAAVENRRASCPPLSCDLLVRSRMRICYLVGSAWVSFGPDQPDTRCSGADCSLIVQWAAIAIQRVAAPKAARLMQRSCDPLNGDCGPLNNQ